MDNIQLTIYNPEHKMERGLFRKYILDNYDSSCDGASTLISALTDHYSYVIILTKNNIIKGAASYSHSKRNLFIEVDHIGVIDHERGYGSLLMKAIFKMARTLNKSVSLMANGSSNEFYEKIGMYKVSKNGPAIYELSIDDLKLLDVMGIVIRFHTH